MRAAFCLFILFVRLAAQTIEVTPSRILIDETATIRVTGCQPGERLTIQSELIDGSGGRWRSQSEFVADLQGSIDTSTQAPTGGSYKEVSAMGLVWSMKPVGSKEGRYQPPSQFRRPNDRVPAGARRDDRFDGAFRTVANERLD